LHKSFMMQNQLNQVKYIVYQKQHGNVWKTWDTLLAPPHLSSDKNEWIGLNYGSVFSGNGTGGY